MLAERTEHPGLRKMHVAVDEAGQDQPVGDGRDDQSCVPRGDLVMRAEVGDPAILDDQQPIGVEARRFTLATDMPPGIVDEVEECAGCRPRSLRDRLLALRARQGAAIVPATSNGRATLSPPPGRGSESG